MTATPARVGLDDDLLCVSRWILYTNCFIEAKPGTVRTALRLRMRMRMHTTYVHVGNRFVEEHFKIRVK